MTRAYPPRRRPERDTLQGSGMASAQPFILTILFAVRSMRGWPEAGCDDCRLNHWSSDTLFPLWERFAGMAVLARLAFPIFTISLHFNLRFCTFHGLSDRQKFFTDCPSEQQPLKGAARPWRRTDKESVGIA